MQRITAIFLLSLLFIPAAFPVCNVPQPRLVCAEYFHSDVVVIAKLTITRHVVPKNDIDGYIYELSSEKVLRGHVVANFRVYEENSSGRATFGWKRGVTYLLFLQYAKEYRAFVLDGCGNSGPLSQATAALKVIQAIAGKQGTTLQGVVSYEALSSPVAGVTVNISGNGRVYRKVTDERGKFQIHLPAGTYVAKPTRPGYTFTPSELSYEDPNKITLENGSCAQVQFVCKEGQTMGASRSPDHSLREIVLP